MIGTLRWNVAMGLVGFFLSFATSITNNIFTTAFLRSLYSGLILFIIAFLFRWILGMILHWHDPVANSSLGSKLDLTTPDESREIHDLLRNQTDEGSGAEDVLFTPLNPPKLISKNNLDPEQLVKAIRHISEE